MTTIDTIMAEHIWNEISGCPGRYRLAVPLPSTSPGELVVGECVVLELRSSECRDAIELILFQEGGGLLSYRRTDGTYLHTLNTKTGLERKLKMLGLNEYIPNITTE